MSGRPRESAREGRGSDAGIERNEFSLLLHDIFERNGLGGYVSERTEEAFLLLTERLRERNREVNLTAITEPARVISLHFADCVMAAARIPRGASVADVGCGAGFPLLPLAIVRSDLRLTGIESTGKKAQFVAETAEALGVASRVTILTARAEDLARSGGTARGKGGAAERTCLRESFDAVVARAVAGMRVLGEICLPLVRVGGVFLAMKGAAGEDEVREAAEGLIRLGGRPEPTDVYRLQLAEGEEQRALAVIRKVAVTPPAYPRPFAAIRRAPL